MPFEVIMPRLTHDMEEGKIIKWLVNEGDSIQKGDILLEIETNKAVAEIEAEQSGILVKKLCSENDAVLIGKVIAIIKEAGEKYIGIANQPDESPVENLCKEKEANRNPREDIKDSFFKHPGSSNRIRISPLARKIAREKNIDPGKLSGSGPGGRIIYKDVVDYAKELKSSDSRDLPYEIKQLSATRKITAERMLESCRNQPAFTLEIDVNMEQVLDHHQKRQRDKKEISITTILIKAIARNLEKFPEVNASYSQEGIRQHSLINISVAMTTPDGLMVPVIKRANKMSLQQIQDKLVDLRMKAKDNKLGIEEISEGTFTISNLGMFGIERFTAIINPPQGAILAIGAIMEKPVVINHSIEIRPIMNMRLSVDHRLLDGHYASLFLSSLKKTLESTDFNWR